MAVRERMNRAMRRRASQMSPPSQLEPPLQLLLDAGFVERDGCVFLAAAADPAPQGKLLDRTGREALVNHIHVEDQLATDDSAEAAGQALRYARAAAEQLASDFPGSAFHVVLAIGDSATVRFYRLRADEPPWISPDLEGYEKEAVLLLTVSRTGR